MTTYPLSDRIPRYQLQKYADAGYILNDDQMYLAERGQTWSNNGRLFIMRVKRAGEHRRLKAGEWFISGAIVEGYFCPYTIGEYDVAELVLVQIETVYTEIAV